MESSAVVIIPAYNEAATIEKVVKNVKEHCDVIVVCDCSTDNTAELARREGAIVVEHSVNKGYDRALNSGFEKASKCNYEYVVTFDADGQHNPSLIPVFLEHLRQGTSLVIGIRPHPARFMEYIFAFYTRYLFGIRDPLCGMKGYRIALYHDHGCFDSYQSIGTELAFSGKQKKCTFKQVPVTIAEREDQPRFGRSLRSNLKILRAMIYSFRFLI